MQQQLHLRDIYRIVRKNRVAFFLVFFLSVAGAALVTFTATPVYEAKTKVVIDRSDPDELTDRSRVTRVDPEFFETQYQVIKSRVVANRVVEMLRGEKEDVLSLLPATSDKDRFHPVAWVKSLVGMEPKDESQPATDPDDLLAQSISDGLKVRPVENSRLVMISFESPEPHLASLVVNHAVDAYMEEINRMKAETSRSSVKYMNQKAAGEEQKLKKGEQGLQEYIEKNDMLTLENRLAVIPEKLSRIATELVSAEARRKELEVLTAKVGRGAIDPEAAESMSQVLSDQALQSLRAQIVVAEKNILELSGKYGPKHPAMLKAEGDLEILKRKKSQEINRIARSIRNDYELALANEKNLRAQMAQTKEEALRANEKFVKFQTMQGEVQTNRKLFDALMLKMNEEGITGESQSVKLWVVEKAGIPLVPAKPMKALNLSLGLVLGLFGGLGVAFFREYLDNTIRDPDDTETVFHTPVLGTVSLQRGREPVERIVLDDPLSAAAESYKSLRTSLLAGSKLPRRFLITSSLPGEGKTSTSANLALALAQAEYRVVLIDGDLRKPRLHDIFRLGNRNGLSRLLARNPDAQTLAQALQPGPLPNLSVLSSGPIPPNPSELLMSSRMKELLRLLEEKFDIIVCDSPPLLAVEDSRILSRLFHGTVVVTKAHKTTYEIAGRSLKLLRGVKAPILGFVVNALDQRKSDYYYHSQYYTAYQAEPLKLKG